MTNFKRILPAAFAAGALLPAGTAAAADEDGTKCKQRFDKRALSGAVENGVLTVSPLREGTTLKATSGAKKRVLTTVEGAKVTFDVKTLEAETFEVVRLREGKGQIKLRLEATGKDAQDEVQTLAFTTKVKSFSEVCKTEKAKDDDDSSDKGKGRGPESDEERETRKDAGEGRGPETDEERDARKDEDEDEGKDREDD